MERAKRIGKEKSIEILRQGGHIFFREWYCYKAGYRVEDKDENEIGFITYDLFYYLFKEELIKKYRGGYGIERWCLNND